MPTTAAHLDLRLNAADKKRINRAADLRGVPLSVFVRDAVLREAESVMTAELTWHRCQPKSRVDSSGPSTHRSSPMRN